MQAQWRRFEARGGTVLEPGEGALASGLTGQGRLPEIADIVEAAEAPPVARGATSWAITSW